MRKHQTLTLLVIKGKYFKNKNAPGKSTDIDIDGMTFTAAIKEWWWKDSGGEMSSISKGGK